MLCIVRISVLSVLGKLLLVGWLLFYNIVCWGDDLSPCIYVVMLCFLLIRAPSFKYDFRVCYKLFWTTHRLPFSIIFLIPKLSFITWRWLADLITKVSNNVQSIFSEFNFLFSILSGLKSHVMSWFTKTNQNWFNGDEFPILLDFLPSNVPLSTSDENFELKGYVWRNY